MKKKYKDWAEGFFLSGIFFFGIFIIDKIKDINTINPIILFIISFFGIVASIKLLEYVFKWQ